MNEQVTEFINNVAQDWQKELCTQFRQVVNKAYPEVQEKIQYSKPHFLKGKQYVAVIGTAKEYVSFTIFNAQTLQPPEGMFESSDTGDRKTIKVRKGQAVDYDLMERLLKQSISTI
jgi:hypothetical protein